MAAARNGTVVQEAPHAQQQATFVLLVPAAAFPRLVFVDAVGQQRVTDSPVIAGSALPKALEKKRQQFQFERRTAFRAQCFCQGYDLVVTEVERADVVRRHAHHHPWVRSNGDTCYNLIAHNDMQLKDRNFRAAA